MPMITNQQMHKALTIVLDIAKVNTIPTTITDPVYIAKRDEQLEAIRLVEHLQTTMFMQSLTQTKEG